MSSHEDFLQNFGWNDFFAKHFASLNDAELIPARVIGQEKDLCRVQLSLKIVWPATIAGKLRFEGGLLPAVGDWVACRVSGDRAVIHHVLPRKSSIERKSAGTNIDVQVIATNVDHLLIATSVNEDLNARRLERYLTLGWDSGAVPVIVLTKMDLAEDRGALQQNVESDFPGVAVLAVSNEDPDSLQQFTHYLSQGNTCAVVGSSGVGKSTLINNLIGAEVLKTQSIRENDGRGRHTTTARYLFKSFFGGLIIDTPGMREIQMAGQEEGFEKSFADIEELCLSCRFGDCAHDSEPGCAVKTALASGGLPQERWENYQKLLAEIRYFQRKTDKAAMSEEKKKWKRIHQAVRLHKKLKTDI